MISYTDRIKFDDEFLFRKSIVPLMIVDENRVIVETNERFCEIFQYERDEILGKMTSILTPTEEHFHQYKQKFEKTKDGSFESDELLYKKKDGSLFWVKLTGLPIYLEGKKFILWSFDDITKEVLARENLKDRYLELEVIFDKVRSGIVYVVDGIIERCNRSFFSIINDIPENILGKKIYRFIECFDECKNSNDKKIKQFHKEDGTIMMSEMERVKIRDESYIIVLTDVTSHLKEKEHLLYLSQTDPLTKIYNRRAFVSIATSMIIEPSFSEVSIVLLDIDFF